MDREAGGRYPQNPAKANIVVEPQIQAARSDIADAKKDLTESIVNLQAAVSKIAAACP